MTADSAVTQVLVGAAEARLKAAVRVGEAPRPRRVGLAFVRSVVGPAHRRSRLFTLMATRTQPSPVYPERGVESSVM